MNKVKNKNGKQKYIIIAILALMLLFTSQTSAYSDTIPVAEYTITDVHNMSELMASVNDTSIINISNGEYQIYESIGISSVFDIEQDTKIHGNAFLSFINEITINNINITGSNQYGIYIQEYSNIRNSYFKNIKIRIENVPISMGETIFQNTSFINSVVYTKSAYDISISQCAFSNSDLKIHFNPIRCDGCIIKINELNLIESYFDLYGADVEMLNSNFNDSPIHTENTRINISNSNFKDGGVSFTYLRASEFKDSTFDNTPIRILTSASNLLIHDNMISNSTYGIQLGAKGSSRTSLSSTKIYNNEIYNIEKVGIYLYNAHPNGKDSRSYIHDNHIYNTPIAIQSTGGESFWGTNTFYDNVLEGDVIMDNLRGNFKHNIIDGDVFINSDINKLIDNDISGNVTVSDVSIGIYVQKNNVSKIDVINSFDLHIPREPMSTFPKSYTWLCSAEVNGGIFIENNTAQKLDLINSNSLYLMDNSNTIYNLLTNSNSNHISTPHQVNVTTDSTIANLSVNNNSYVFNGSSHLQDNNLVFSVLTGGLYSINVSGLNGTYDLFKDSDLIRTVDSIDDSCLFEVNMSIGDYLIVDNTTIATPTPEPAIEQSSGGSSGSIGGGGKSDESYKNIESSDVDRQLAVKDSTVTFSYKKDDNPIESITFTPLKSMDWVISKIEILKDTSTLVSTSAPNEIYKNLNIWVGKAGQVTESNTDDIMISFSVDKSWITGNDINPDTITLNHYTGDSWHKLNTIEVSNTQNRISFEAVTDSFSPFAITGTKNTVKQVIPTIKPTQEPTNEPVVETVNIPQKSIFKTIIKWFKSYKWW